jgi:dUTP pyrophosphatase
MVGLINLGPEAFTIRRHDRIAQLVLARVDRARPVESAELDETGRQDGGFGHTGV